MTVKLSEESIAKAHETLPKHMADTLVRYFEDAVPPGDFLYAVLTNDLVRAFAHADHINKPIIESYINWLYWEAPGRPYGWGSAEAVDKWISDHNDPTAYEA